MKVDPKPTTVVISGASAGLGGALARAYAAPGRTLGLIARDQGRLAATARDCRNADATVETGILDVTDAAAVASWATALETKFPIDLVIANAGVYTGHDADGTMESVGDIAWMARVNLEGVANLINAVLPGMRARKRGHIAIIGSLAALQPLADAPGYSASKAGVMAYGEALREYLIPDGITVTLVYPGHIETAQVKGHVGALPHIMTPAKAAEIIKTRLDQGRTFIAFPWQLLWLIRAGRALPWRLRALAGKDFRFQIDRIAARNPPPET